VISFFVSTSTTTPSKAAQISCLNCSVNTPYSNWKASIFLLTADFNQENEKSRLSCHKIGTGRYPRGISPKYCFAKAETYAQPGKVPPIIFDTLSKASPAASS
jgi:hypothetical protein